MQFKGREERGADARPGQSASRRFEPFTKPLAVSIPECSRLTSLGRTLIFQLIAEGRLEARRVERRTLVLMRSLPDCRRAPRLDDTGSYAGISAGTEAFAAS